MNKLTMILQSITLTITPWGHPNKKTKEKVNNNKQKKQKCSNNCVGKYENVYEIKK